MVSNIDIWYHLLLYGTILFLYKKTNMVDVFKKYMVSNIDIWYNILMLG